MISSKIPKLTGCALSAVLLSAAAIHSFAEVGNPRVNQVGYLPNGAKYAAYAADNNTAQTWQLRSNGTLVASGQTIPTGVDAASGDNVHHIDISNITAEGSGYTLHVGDDQSYEFDIAANAFRGVMYDSIKYFYHNRSGIEIETQYTGGGNGSFASDSRWARPAGHLNQGANQGDFNVPCWTGTCNYSLDVTKGWYDAGDHGKYVVNGGISVWKLLNMYERALHVSDNAPDFADGTLNIPESGNGVPDILDEVRWQLEFMLAMQVPEGEAKAGMVHHKMHDVGWTGLPLAPHEDSQSRALVPPSVTATLNVAAVGAQCARLWQGVDATFANTCLTAAEKAWDAAQANPNDLYSGNYNNGGGGYGDNDASDEFFWAAAELYITTGDSRYLPTVTNYSAIRTDYAWPDTELPALMSLAVVPTAHTTDLSNSARQQLVSVANGHVATINSTGYLIPTTEEEYYWGSNNVLANKMSVIGLAYDFTGDNQYAQAFGQAFDYLFGRNTLSFSFISGHGDDALTQPHHRFWAGALNSNYPWLPPGSLSGGPNAGLEDEVAQAALSGCEAIPASCFMDDINSWSTNEITINWNSALAWVTAFYHDYGDAVDDDNGPENTAPVANFTTSTTTGEAPLAVSFNASGSTDADGDALGYSWNFGDGNSATGVTASHSYSTPGTYTVALSVTDGNGGSDSATTTVTVEEVDPGTGGGGTSSCNLVITNDWGSGAQADVSISNEGSEAINGWLLVLTLPNGVSLDGSWNVNVSGSNPYDMTPVGWNSTIQPGASVSFGMQLSRSGNGDYSAIELSGDVCASGPPPDTNTAPTANFTSSVQDLTVSLNASASSDPDGDALSFSWNFGDGTTATGVTATHTYASAGDYTITLTASDGQTSDSANTTVTVTSSNGAPEANFTSSVSDLTLSVDASSSSDPDGDALQYNWDFGDGTTATGVTATHTYASAGDYVVVLVVNDGQAGSTVITNVTVTSSQPTNGAPEANFTSSVSDLTLSVDASSSSDPDGDALQYNWDFGDGTTATGVTATHTYASAGDYVVVLVVNDGQAGSTVISNVTVTSSPDTNAAPEASFTSSVSDLTLSVDASSSSDLDGDALQYHWDFGDGTTAAGVTATHSYASAGDYVVVLVVNDGQAGSTVISNVTVTSSQPTNGAPQASFTSSVSDLSLSVDGSSSSDPDGDALQYNWDFGDGTTATGATPSHTYSAAGDYQVVLTVTDGELSDSSAQTVTVSAADTGGGACQFVIVDEWNSGYTAAIRITNSGSTAINGWSVQWQYSDGATLVNSWNARVSGSNPYTASDMGWNGTIQPGQTVEFGLQANKGSSPAQVPTVTGDVCQ